MRMSLAEIDAQLATLGSVPAHVTALVDRYGGRGLSLQEADVALRAIAEGVATGEIPAAVANGVSRERAISASSQAVKSVKEATKLVREAAKPAKEATKPAKNTVKEAKGTKEAAKAETQTAKASNSAAGARKPSDVVAAPVDLTMPLDGSSMESETVTVPLPAPEGSYPDVSVEAGPERDEDGTVTNVFTQASAAAMVPRRNKTAASSSQLKTEPPSGQERRPSRAYAEVDDEGDEDGTVTNLFNPASLAASISSNPAPPNASAREGMVLPDPEGSYPDVSVEAGPQRDEDGTVTSVFTHAAAAAMVPARSSTPNPSQRAESRPPAVAQSRPPLAAAEDEEEILVDEFFDELIEEEIELIE